MVKSKQVSLCLALIGLVVTVFISNAQAAEEELTKLAKIELADQFDNMQSVDESTKVLIFVHDMEGNDIVEQAFEPYNAVKLAEMKVVFLADISGMPSLIGRLFALPAMRDRAYSIMLDREGALIEKFIVKEEQITVMYLDNLAIKESKLVATAEELSSLLNTLSK